MKELGKVDPKKFRDWCISMSVFMEREKWYGKPVSEDRELAWFGVGINFDRNLSRFQGLAINNGLKKRCLEFYDEDFNSLLLIKYGNGSKLNLHKDRDCFDKKVIIINSGICVFQYGEARKILKDGGVYEIDGRTKHGVVKVVGQRFSLSIRKVT
jgi:alkylated DNA repair dioxygenase AlkB